MPYPDHHTYSGYCRCEECISFELRLRQSIKEEGTYEIKGVPRILSEEENRKLYKQL